MIIQKARLPILESVSHDGHIYRSNRHIRVSNDTQRFDGDYKGMVPTQWLLVDDAISH